MIAAGENTKNGRKTLYLGLQDANVERLAGGEPILIRCDGEGNHVRIPGLEMWDIVIMGPDDVVGFTEAVQVEEAHKDERG